MTGRLKILFKVIQRLTDAEKTEIIAALDAVETEEAINEQN